MHTTKESLYLFSSVTNLTFDWHPWIDHEGTAQQVRFTIVNFVYLFLTIVKAFYYTKLSSVIGENKSTRGFYFLSRALDGLQWRGNRRSVNRWSRLNEARGAIGIGLMG